MWHADICGLRVAPYPSPPSYLSCKLPVLLFYREPLVSSQLKGGVAWEAQPGQRSSIGALSDRGLDAARGTVNREVLGHGQGWCRAI